MALHHELVGTRFGPVERSWGRDATLLYALGVGAGSGDPAAELAFTTDNTAGVEQQVLPTFSTVAGAVAGLRPPLGDFDRARLVHAEQAVEVHAPLPAEGRALVSSTVTGMYDKGTGALVTTTTEAVDAGSGKPLFTNASAVFVRGEGGFGGAAGPRDGWRRPDRDPDRLVRLATRPEQALLYRLSGDRNPLHSDPAFARRAGFDRPILHGLCTFGFAARALLAAACDGDVTAFASMRARFSAPVTPGDDLEVAIWDTGGEVAFQTARGDGTIVLDRGRLRRSPR